MNKNKLTKVTLCILLMSTIFSFLPVVYADPPEEWDPWQKGGRPAYMYKKPGYFGWNYGESIGAWYWPWIGPGGEQWIPHDEYSYLRVGWLVSDYEIEQGWDPGPPYKYRLFIDGEEIVMRRWARHYKNVEVLFPNGEVHTTDMHVWMWTVRFDPGFFEQGKDYEIRIQFLVNKPYYGSDSKIWRFYENHLTGGYYPPGGEDPVLFEDWYGPAGLVWDQSHTLHVY